MAMISIPRDGTIFDNFTTDCLNTQINNLDKSIDDVNFEDILYNKRIVSLPLEEPYFNKSQMLDQSFALENMYCLRITLNITSQYTWWVKLGRLPLDLPIEYVGQMFSKNGFLYRLKVEDGNLYFSGKSDSVDGYIYDQLVIVVDLPVLTNKYL